MPSRWGGHKRISIVFRSCHLTRSPSPRTQKLQIQNLPEFETGSHTQISTFQMFHYRLSSYLLEFRNTYTSGVSFCSKAITGEARPVEKRKEHKISSGCVILNGYVGVTLTKDHANSTLSQIEAKAWACFFLKMQRICHRSRTKYLLFGQVEEAQMQRTNKQLILERFARIWTPAVLISVPRPSDSDGNDVFGIWFWLCRSFNWFQLLHLDTWGADCMYRGALGYWSEFSWVDSPWFGDPTHCLSLCGGNWCTFGYHMCHCCDPWTAHQESGDLADNRICHNNLRHTITYSRICGE